jgi:hypothetical protein
LIKAVEQQGTLEVDDKSFSGVALQTLPETGAFHCNATPCLPILQAAHQALKTE